MHNNNYDKPRELEELAADMKNRLSDLNDHVSTKVPRGIPWNIGETVSKVQDQLSVLTAQINTQEERLQKANQTIAEVNQNLAEMQNIKTQLFAVMGMFFTILLLLALI